MDIDKNQAISGGVRLGDLVFQTDPPALLDAAGQEIPLRPKTLEVLEYLVARSGKLVSKDDLFARIWPDTIVGDDSLTQCIFQIRQALGPQAKEIVQTVPKRGYRLLASPLADTAATGAAARERRAGSLPRAILALAVLAVLVLAWVLVLRPSPAPAPARVGPVTVAVLPFLSGDDPGQEYFSTGISEDLTVDLSRISDLRVLSTGATGGYRTVDRDPLAIAAELGVDYLVDGSVRRVAESLRISVQLVDGRNRANLWAGRFDGDTDEIFELQASVLVDLTRIIAVQLSQKERDRLGVRGTRNVLAYDAFLQGRYDEARFTRDGNAAAIDAYRRAVRIDPGFGIAYSRQANVHVDSLRVGWEADRGSSLHLAVDLAEKGVEASPDSAYAWWALGRILPRLKSQAALDRGLSALEKALELRPGYRDALAFQTFLLVSAGRPEDALASITTALEDGGDVPYWYWQALGTALWPLGRLDEAIDALERGLEQNPNALFLRLTNAAILVMAGRQEDAEWELEEARAQGFNGTVESIFDNTLTTHEPYVGKMRAALMAAGVPE